MEVSTKAQDPFNKISQVIHNRKGIHDEPKATEDDAPANAKQMIPKLLKIIITEMKAIRAQEHLADTVKSNVLRKNEKGNLILRSSKSLPAQENPVGPVEPITADKTAKQSSTDLKSNKKRLLHPTESDQENEALRKRKIKLITKKASSASTSTDDPSPIAGPFVTVDQTPPGISYAEIPAPKFELSTSTEVSPQHSLETTESPTASSAHTPSSMVESENEKRVIKNASDDEIAADVPVLKRTIPQKAAKDAARVVKRTKATPKESTTIIQVPKARVMVRRLTREERAQKKKCQADPNDNDSLARPYELAKMIYTDMSSAYFEQKLGKVFPNTGAAPSVSLNVNWPKDSPKDHTEKMEAWLEKEKKWAKVGVPARPRPSWSFKPAPKNLEKAKFWLNSHGQTLEMASQASYIDDRPLQRPGYVTEYSKMSKQVRRLGEKFEVYPGALRVDDDDSESFKKYLARFAAADVSDDRDEFDVEGYDERMLRIKSCPANDTIEYDDSVDAEHADSVKEATDAMKRGDVSGAHIRSDRWHFTRSSQRNTPKPATDQALEEKENSELAALALMQLSFESSMAR